MKFFVFIFFFLIGFVHLTGQEEKECKYELRGVIFDIITKEPLPFVTVRIEGTDIGTASVDDGSFELLNLCQREYELVFSRIGYKDLEHHHDFHHPEMQIYLAEQQYNLEGITVEAQKSEADLQTVNSQSISGEALEIVRSESLGEIASLFTGVGSLNSGQNISKPIIHGLHSNRILVINNGIRHEFQNWGIDHAPEIDPSITDQIEVVKGAGTVRFGPDALGGVLLLNPNQLELSTPFKGRVGLIGKTNGKSGELNLGLEKGFKWLSLAAKASFSQQGDLQAPNYLLTNTGKVENSYSGRFRIHPSPHFDIEGYYSHVDQNLGILAGATFSNLDDIERALESPTPLSTGPFSYHIDQPRQQISHDLYKLTAKYIGEHQTVEIQYGYQTNFRKEFGLRRGDAPNINLVLKTHNLDLNWFHGHLGPFTSRIGVQGMIQANDNIPGTNTVPFIPNYDQQRFGAYWINTFEWKNNLLEIGARYDYLDSYIVGREPDNTIYRNDLVFENFSYTIGYKTSLRNGHSFRSNFGTAWRAPNIAELYRFGQHSFFLEYGLWRYTIDDQFDFVVTTEGILDETDRPVDPEVGFKWINNYEIKKDHFRAEFTGYINYVQNYILTTPGGFTRTPRGVFIFYLHDQADALFWGLDLATEWDHRHSLISAFKTSYLWSKQISNDDYLVEQPPANLWYQLSYQPNIKGLTHFSVNLNASYTFEQFMHPRILSFDEFLSAYQNDVNRFTGDAKNFDIIPPPPGYFLANFSISANWKSMEFNFRVKNILNTSYRSYTDRMRYFADAVGRNFILGLHYNL